MSRTRSSKAPSLAWLLLAATALLSCDAVVGVHGALRLRAARPTVSSTTPTSIATTSSQASEVAEQPLDAVTPEPQLQVEVEAEAASEQKPDKHKRGILHGLHGGAVAAGGHWPARTYAAQYGYSLQLPAAATFLAAAPSAHRHHAFVKQYPAHYHVKQFAPAALLPSAVAGLAGAVPALPTVQALPTVPAVQAALPAVPTGIASALPAAPSFVLRPGNAVVSSYSVNYPHQQLHRPLKPVHFHHAVQVSQHL